MATRKKSVKQEAARGVTLVEEVIQAIESGRPGELENPERAGIDTEHLALPDGRPLPASLRRWLAFDGNCLQELILPTDPPTLRVMTLPELARRYVKDDAEAEGEGLYLPLRAGVGVFAIHVGEADENGEYPVVDVREGDMFGGVEVEVVYAGFDVFLAWVGYVVEDPERVYAKALRAARKRNPFISEEDLLDFVE